MTRVTVVNAGNVPAPSRQVIEAAECQDCDSWIRLEYAGVDQADGRVTWSVDVAHRRTCPWMRARGQ